MGVDEEKGGLRLDRLPYIGSLLVNFSNSAAAQGLDGLLDNRPLFRLIFMCIFFYRTMVQFSFVFKFQNKNMKQVKPE